MTTPDALPVTRRVLNLLVALNWVVGVMVLTMFVASIAAPEWLMRALGIKAADATAALLLDMRIMMVIGLVAVPLTFVVLRRLIEIVDTVGAGDAFVSQNAQRLTTIGWLLLALNVLNLAVGVVIRGVFSDARALEMDWEFSFTPWLAVLLSFVLARVFEQGARMREDLAGTV